MTAPGVSVELDFAMNERLQRLAETRQLTPKRIVQDAVEAYVEREERRAQLRDEVRQAWSHYEATGLHATEEEADLWLSKLEAGEDAVPPACHV